MSRTAAPLQTLAHPRPAARRPAGRVGAAVGSVPPLVRALFLVDLGLGAAYLLADAAFRHWVPASVRVSAGESSAAEFRFRWLSRLFDLNAEANLPTWYASAQLLLVGLLLGVFARARADRRRPAASAGLVVAAALFVGMSADEVACLHENVGGKLVHYLKARSHGSAVTLAAFWAAVLVPFLAVVACVARAGWSHWRRRPAFALRFGLGLAVYLACAAGTELAWMAAFGTDPSAAPVEVFAEEVGEMIGVTLMAWAAWDLLVAERISLSFGPAGVGS